MCRSPLGYGNMSTTYARGRSPSSTGSKTFSSSQTGSHLSTMPVGSYPTSSLGWFISCLALARVSANQFLDMKKALTQGGPPR